MNLVFPDASRAEASGFSFRFTCFLFPKKRNDGKMKRKGVGHFQGIRMIFGVLLPMILGPAIGAAVIRGSDSTYVELGVVKTVPTPAIFLAAAVVLLLTVPFVLLLRGQTGKLSNEVELSMEESEHE